VGCDRRSAAVVSAPPGWRVRPTQKFGNHVGPFYEPEDGNPHLCGFRTDDRHGNKRGVTQGGMLATAFDVGMGSACWAAAGGNPCATMQLNIHYLGALKLGEFGIVRAEITRATKSVVFVRGTLTAEERLVATADGVWKILNWRGEPWRPPE
jgi:acyl-coenzyme A thioesterase PaaI-like protein